MTVLDHEIHMSFLQILVHEIWSHHAASVKKNKYIP